MLWLAALIYLWMAVCLTLNMLDRYKLHYALLLGALWPLVWLLLTVAMLAFFARDPLFWELEKLDLWFDKLAKRSN